MDLVVTHNVPESLTGRLTRWLVRVDGGVFVGRLSARERDRLWATLREGRGGGRVLQAWSEGAGQEGFRWRRAGEWARRLEDREGLTLAVRSRTDSPEEKG